MKTKLTTLHNEITACEMTGPVPAMRAVLALLIRVSAFGLYPSAFPTRLLWAAALALSVFDAEGAALLTTLHSFGICTNGAHPYAGLVQGSDGNFYGTTQGGGTNGGTGTVFRMSTNGALTALHSFTGGSDGAGLGAGLVQGSDGYFYGTTAGGGTNGQGTMFRISTNGALTSLYLFTGGNDGAYPQAGLVQGSDGYLYGTTYGGGTNGQGTVFRISTSGALTTLHSFTGGVFEGANPQAGLVEGSDGYFYGTTVYGGTNGNGTVFKISTNGTLTTLHSFAGGVFEGANPQAGLVEGSDGYFYGTTFHGGNTTDTDTAYLGWGTVFKVSTSGALATLHYFTGGNDGGNPAAGLVQGSDGYFYGTTAWGGTNLVDTAFGVGTVFKVSANGALTSLYSFTGGKDGASPQAGLVQGSSGDFFGTTCGLLDDLGCRSTLGTVFRISANGTLTTLHPFTDTNDGGRPGAGLAQGSDGNFYGTTHGISAYFECSPRGGTVFEVSANGTLTTLHPFTVGDDGAAPQAGLVQGSDGYFYGTTEGGGWLGEGTVFRISTDGALTSLYSFGTTLDAYGVPLDGAYPQAGLAPGSDGYFYGTTRFGGTNPDYGTVFKISTNGVLTSLYSFTGGNHGAYPQARLVQGNDGNLYGTSSGTVNGLLSGYGTVFKIGTNGALTTLHSFTGGEDGSGPVAGLVQGSDGYFYGTTAWGSTNGAGTVFKMSNNGALTSLYSFTGGNDGAEPRAELVQGSDGYFYGTTYGGGTNGQGTVFRISTSGALTTLHSFTGGVFEGANPQAGLVEGSDGRFYGTTYGGGQGGVGTVFRLTIVPAAPVFHTATLTDSALGLTWSTEAGRTYQLQYNSDLGSSNWTNLGNPIAATGATLSATDAVTNGPRRFYRVVLSP